MQSLLPALVVLALVQARMLAAPPRNQLHHCTGLAHSLLHRQLRPRESLTALNLWQLRQQAEAAALAVQVSPPLPRLYLRVTGMMILSMGQAMTIILSLHLEPQQLPQQLQLQQRLGELGRLHRCSLNRSLFLLLFLLLPLLGRCIHPFQRMPGQLMRRRSLPMLLQLQPQLQLLQLLTPVLPPSVGPGRQVVLACQ